MTADRLCDRLSSLILPRLPDFPLFETTHMTRATQFTPFLRIVLVYLVLSLLWILLSDRAVSWLSPPALHGVLQTWKGWFFVLVTTALLYGLLRRVHGQMHAATQRELEAARQAARSAMLLHALVESSSDAIFAKDRDGRYLVFNREAARVTGRSVEDVLGQDDRLLFPPEQAARVMANDRRVMEQARTEHFEESLDTAQGARTFLATKGPLHDASGVHGMFGISRDITDMVRVREALQESERRYRQMFESSPLAMWLHDPVAGRILDVNGAAVAQYGYSRDEFLEMPLERLHPPAQLVALHQDFSVFEQGGTPAGERSSSWLHRCKDGHLIEVEMSGCPVEFERRTVQLTVALDVSARNRLQRERDAVSQRLSSVLERVTDAFVSIDRAQHLTYVNERAAQWLAPGTAARELQGRFVWDLVPDAIGTAFQDAVQQALETGQQTVAEDWYEPWQRWMELRVYPAPQGATAYFTDVTARRESEEALRRSQRELSALSRQLLLQEQTLHRLLAQSLHDRLGQQLGSARLYLDVLLARAGFTGEEAARLSGAIDAAIAEVRHVLRDLRPPLLAEQGLQAALENELMHSPAQALGVQVHLSGDAQLDHLRWSDDVEYAVFMIAREAIANALRHAKASQLTVRLEGDAQRLLLQVRDDGVGVNEYELAALPGHLGLVGMRERATAIGATLSVSASGDQGTLVELVWPGDAVVGTGGLAP